MTLPDADDADNADGRRFILLIINISALICARLRCLRPMNTDIRHTLIVDTHLEITISPFRSKRYNKLLVYSKMIKMSVS